MHAGGTRDDDNAALFKENANCIIWSNLPVIRTQDGAENIYKDVGYS